MDDKEKPTEDLFEKLMEDCARSFDYYDYLDEMYGHGYASSDSELMLSDEMVEVNHLINTNENDDENDADISDDELEEFEAAYYETGKLWATEKVKQLESEKFKEGSLYFSSVPEGLKKAFEYATKELRKIAHKNGGYIRVDDSYSPAFNQASVELVARGVHFENDDMFKTIMRFFAFAQVAYREGNEVAVYFIRPEYFDVKEVKI